MANNQEQRSSARWRKSPFATIVFGMALLGLTYFFWPRQADLRSFHPEAVAELETAMWRHYYQKEYLPLFSCLYSISREQYAFSPWDSVRLAYYAAKAAKIFQPSRSRLEAERSIPVLERYFQLMRNRSQEQFDAGKAARLELDWWQLRREKAAPAQYGNVIASVTVELYATNGPSLQQAALIRAEMMTYRDEHAAGPMRDEDWTHIELGLRQSYQLLKTQIQR